MNVIKTPIIKNGAKGISDFMEYFLPASAIKNNPTIDPRQKAKIRANTPDESPRSQPIPKINFPSPMPINFPFEKYDNKTKGKANIGPERTLKRPAQVNNIPKEYKPTIKETKDKILKR